MNGYKNISRIVSALTRHARAVRTLGETERHHTSGELEVISDGDGNFFLSIKYSTKRKRPSDSRWDTTHIFVTLSPEAWEHLHTAPKFTPPTEDTAA